MAHCMSVRRRKNKFDGFIGIPRLSNMAIRNVGTP